MIENYDKNVLNGNCVDKNGIKGCKSRPQITGGDDDKPRRSERSCTYKFEWITNDLCLEKYILICWYVCI